MFKLKKGGFVIYILLFLANATWGFNIIITKFNYDSFDPLFLVYLKIFFSMLSLLVYIYFKKIPFEKASFKQVVINTNLINVLNFMMTYLALKTIKGSQVATINCLSPLIMACITFKQQKWNFKKIGLFFFILVGFFITIHFDFSTLNISFFMMLGALLFYNIGNYRLRSINQNLFIYNFYMFFVAFVELTVFLLFQHEQLFYHIYRFPFWLFVLSSGIGYAFIQSVSFFSIKKIGPFSTSFFMAFNPLFTYIFSLFFLKESFDWMILIGFLCIFIASLAILKETLKQNKF